jgi:hypothetical protein
MRKSFVYLSFGIAVWAIGGISCKKDGNPAPPPTPPSAQAITVTGIYVNTVSLVNTVYNINTSPLIRLQLSQPVLESSVASSITLTNGASQIQLAVSFQSGDSTVILQPTALNYLAKYTVIIATSLQSKAGGNLASAIQKTFYTQIDSTDKFPRISDSALLTLVQQQTFNYFWAGADPTSGMAKERASQSMVTSGGSGFGIMAMLVGVQRSFITRAQALTRIAAIVNFLTTKCTTYHGAFSHWLNGTSGATVPFSTQDDGADIVETSYLVQGLLCARQFFNSTTDTTEMGLRMNITSLYNAVQWNWFRQNDQNVLTWNWSPDYGWAVNVQIKGWNEALITYVLAASSNIDSNTIPKTTYDQGWAQNGGMKNGNVYYGVPLPLGPAYGGPLFFAHYSFLGINPNGLSDAYANYWTQDTAHSRINYLYCINNPGKFNGYSDSCWGLTASDEQSGYSAHSPDNDDGVISPTAAISSLPYTPAESMAALRFFYYKLGDKAWGQYGFVDAFNLTNIWFDNDCLAIDQGPQIVMIENYRTGLLWSLFMSCPEVQAGMTKLGFQSPNL